MTVEQEAQEMNEADDFVRNEDTSQVELDAARYRKLRAMALGRGNLEAFVACEALDHTRSEKEFDDTVDQGF
jgi:hypothetical protein